MAIAISIDFPRIVAVELSGNARKPRLKRVEIGELAEPRNEDGTPVADRQGHLNAQVAEFVKKNKLNTGKQYLLVGPEAMRYRDLRLAFSDKRQIQRVLQFQVEGLIPNIPIEELSLGYISLKQDDDQSLLLIHAAEREYIRQRIQAIEAGGGAIDAADSHLSGTLNLGLLHEELSADKPPTLWLDFAGTTAAVCVIEGGAVRTARVFVSPYLAGASGAAAGAASAKEAAEAARREAEARAREFQAQQAGDTLPKSDSVTLPRSDSANIGAEQVADRIRHMSQGDLDKFVQRVTVEARRTLVMSTYDETPQRLVVSGLGAEGDHIGRLLGDALGISEVTPIDLMKPVIPTDKGGRALMRAPDLGELTYLTGVALKGLGRDITGIDFRYGNLAAGTLMDYARTPLAFTATLALLISGILFLVTFTHARNYERNIADLRAGGLEDSYKRAFRDIGRDDARVPAKEREESQYYTDAEDPANEIRTNYERMSRHLKRLQGEASDNYERPVPADQVLALVLKAIHDSKPSYDFVLQRVDIRSSNLNLVYLASLSETAEDLAKVGNKREGDRLYEAFRQLRRDHPNTFLDEPRIQPGNAQQRPDGRQAVPVTLQMPLAKPARPRGASGAAKKGT